LYIIATACLACSNLGVIEKELNEEGGMRIRPMDPDYQPQLYPRGGFWITLQTDLAERLQAPEGVEFLKFLDERLKRDEQAMGHKYCQFGYKLSPMFFYKGVFASLIGICLTDPAQNQTTK